MMRHKTGAAREKESRTLQPKAYPTHYHGQSNFLKRSFSYRGAMAWKPTVK